MEGIGHRLGVGWMKWGLSYCVGYKSYYALRVFTTELGKQEKRMHKN